MRAPLSISCLVWEFELIYAGGGLGLSFIKLLMSSVHSSLSVTPVILVFRGELVFGRTFLSVCSKFSFRLSLHCISARAGLILLQLFHLRCLICSFVENILSFITLSVFVIIAALKLFSANSTHGSSLGRFPFLLSMGQFFPFLCMSINFGLYLG